MTNMSYYRFRNTSNDLRDCLDVLDAMVEQDGEDASALGREEAGAALSLISLAELISENIASDGELLVTLRKAAKRD